MSKEDLQAKRALLEAMTNDELREPTTIPVDIYIREAEKLYSVFKDDIESFKSVGFKEEQVNDLGIRIGALREASSLWLTYRYNREEARRIWEERSEEGYRLRDWLLATLKVAYRKDIVLKGRLKAVASGQGHADMVQDINDLAVLGRTNPEPLKLINFDFTHFERAAKMADFLGEILGRFDADNDRFHKSKRLRDAAYTHLKEIVNEIRLFGKYLFHEKREKKLRYYSDFLRKKKRKAMLKAKNMEKKEGEKEKAKVDLSLELPSKSIN